jgi:glycosyltransferase
VKVSIITAVRNGAEIIEQCIKSVCDQSFKNIEYIIIDGNSTDGTLEIIRKYQSKISNWVSEPDNGIYDALNKGMKMATGDIIGFLHADDFYANDIVIELVVSHMTKHNVNSCYGDLEYVSNKNTEKVIRYWKSGPYRDGLFQKGWMPPHPTFFVRKEIYKKYGGFNTDLRIAADYELMLRFIARNKVTTHYIPKVLVNMRTGGNSNRSLRNMLIKSSEDYKAWKMNNLNGGLYTIMLKNLSKLPQFFKR